MTFTYSATSITLPGIILPAKNLPNVVHIQNRQRAEGGGVTVYDGGYNEWYWEIKLSCNESQKDDLLGFIVDTIVFSKYEFTLTPTGTIDLGGGSGVAFDCRYWGEDLPIGIERGGGLYEFSFIVFTTTIGTNRPAS